MINKDTKMDIKENLKEIGEYFKNKLIEGDYQFNKSDKHLATITMDGEFEFSLWICGGSEGFDVYNHSDSSSFVNQYFKFSNDEDQLKAWEIIEPNITAYNKEVLIAEKTKELEELKNSYTQTSF